jgi:hypothetical protein
VLLHCVERVSPADEARDRSWQIVPTLLAMLRPVAQILSSRALASTAR